MVVISSFIPRDDLLWIIFSAAGDIQSPGSSLGSESCPAENQRGVSAA